MVLYVAHNSPKLNSQAARASSALATPSRDTTVLCTMDFDDRGNARKNRDYPTRDICFGDTSAFIILVPPPKDEPATDISLGVQLGAYIQICRQKNKSPRIYCLHHSNVDVSAITALCSPEVIKVVQGNAAAVKDLITQLYPTENRDGIFQTMTSQLLAAVEAQVPRESYTTASVLTLTIVEGDLSKLSSGNIPPNAAIGGDQWEEMFGVSPSQAGLTWGDVRKNVANPSQWEPILAEELEMVMRGKDHRQQNVVPILLDEGTNVSPAAAVVQKYEVYAGNFPDGQDPAHAKLPTVHRFSMVTFRGPVLYTPGDTRPIATAFHLMAVSQMFRFKVLEEDFRQLEICESQLKQKDHIPDAPARTARAIADLRRHLLLIDVECRRRDFLNRLAAFGRLILESLARDASDAAKDAAATEQKRLSDIFNVEWSPIREKIDSAIRGGESQISEILYGLANLKKLNAEVLEITAQAYARLVAIEYPNC